MSVTGRVSVLVYKELAGRCDRVLRRLQREVSAQFIHDLPEPLLEISVIHGHESASLETTRYCNLVSPIDLT